MRGHRLAFGLGVLGILSLAVALPACGGGGSNDAGQDLPADLGTDMPVDLGPDVSTPAMLDSDDASYDFGTLPETATTSRTFRITNEGGSTSSAITTTLSGDPAYSIVVDECDGVVLVPNQSCEITVGLDPSTSGSPTATLTIEALSGGTIPIALSATIVSASDITIDPSPHVFGTTVIGESALPQTFTVTNTGPIATTALTTAITGSHNTQFMIGTDGCSGMVLAPNGMCTIEVTFTPSGTATGMRAASLAASATTGGTGIATLQGMALTPAMLAVDGDDGHDFGTWDAGMPTLIASFTITNGGGQATGTLSTMLTGDTGEFDVLSNTCTGMLDGFASCAIDVIFDPTTFGARSLTVTVSGTPGGAASFTVTGTGRDWVALDFVQPFGGTGIGTVTGGGIDCPATACATWIERTTSAPMVTLTATPDVSSDFGGWGGACASAGTASTCMLTLNDDEVVSATFTIKTFTLTITRQNVGGASGDVSSTSTPTPANEIDCGSSCTRTFDYGTMVTLTPAPTAGFYFGGWTGDCPAGQPVCTLAMTQDRAAEASFSPANRAFVIATARTVGIIKTYATDTSSEAAEMFSGADALCQMAGGASTFRAWLASSTVNAASRLPASARGWVRADGRPFRDRLDAGSPTYYPVVFDETGASTGTELYWTGADSGGVGSALGSCGDWDAGSFAAVGARSGVGDRWTRHGQGSCSVATAFRLLCLDTAYTAFVAPPSTPPAGARLAFASMAPFDPSTGIGAADAICASEAAAASLPGTYLAFMAEDGTSAASRFTSRGDPVYRPDGVQAFATDTVMFSSTGMPIAPIATTAGRQPTPALLVWLGAFDPTAVGSTGNTCHTALGGSWSTTSSGVNAMLGDPYWIPQWMAAANFPCDQASRGLYCMQE